MRQVAVVGQGDRGRRRAPRASRRTSSSAVPGSTPSSAASWSLATPAVMLCRTEATRWPSRCRLCQMPGSAASARLSRPASGAGTHSCTRSSGTSSTVRTDRLCSASCAGRQRRLARHRGGRDLVGERRPPAGTAAGRTPATADDACRNVPSARVWWKEPPVTNQPEPCRLSTSPCSRSSSSARRTVTRLAPYRCPSTASLSRAPESPRSPRAMRSRTSSAMVRNRAPVINLYATSAGRRSTGARGAAGIRGLAPPLLALQMPFDRPRTQRAWVNQPQGTAQRSQGVASHAS